MLVESAWQKAMHAMHANVPLLPAIHAGSKGTTAAHPDSAACLAAEASSEAIARTLRRQQWRCTRRLHWTRWVETSTGAQRDAMRKPFNMSCRYYRTCCGCVLTAIATNDHLHVSISTAG